jgi:hypothetical protein
MTMTQTYEIRIKGHLDVAWSDWFDGLTIRHEENGETLLSGQVTDQAALHGILGRVRDLGLPLISVQAIDERKDQP